MILFVECIRQHRVCEQAEKAVQVEAGEGRVGALTKGGVQLTSVVMLGKSDRRCC
jgi:hypothetical protein